MSIEVKQESGDGSVVVTASNGKAIGIKRPHVLAQYKLVEAIGEAAENRVYLGMCVPLLYVVSIDGDPVPQPSTKLQLEALIGRLDEAGLNAVQAGIAEHFQKKDEVAAAKK